MVTNVISSRRSKIKDQRLEIKDKRSNNPSRRVHLRGDEQVRTDDDIRKVGLLNGQAHHHGPTATAGIEGTVIWVR